MSLNFQTRSLAQTGVRVTVSARRALTIADNATANTRLMTPLLELEGVRIRAETVSIDHLCADATATHSKPARDARHVRAVGVAEFSFEIRFFTRDNAIAD